MHSDFPLFSLFLFFAVFWAFCFAVFLLFFTVCFQCFSFFFWFPCLQRLQQSRSPLVYRCNVCSVVVLSCPMQWPYYQEYPTPAVHIKQKLCLASPVVLTHPQNPEWQKNGTLFDNQNNQRFEMANKRQIFINHQIAGIAKNDKNSRICNFFAIFLPFQFAIPHAIPKGNPNSTKRCFGHPSFCLI